MGLLRHCRQHRWVATECDSSARLEAAPPIALWRKVIGVYAIIGGGMASCQVKWWGCIPTAGMEGLQIGAGSDHRDGVRIEESMQVGVFGDHNQAALGGARDDHMVGQLASTALRP